MTHLFFLFTLANTWALTLAPKICQEIDYAEPRVKRLYGFTHDMVTTGRVRSITVEMLYRRWAEGEEMAELASFGECQAAPARALDPPCHRAFETASTHLSEMVQWLKSFADCDEPNRQDFLEIRDNLAATLHRISQDFMEAEDDAYVTREKMKAERRVRDGAESIRRQTECANTDASAQALRRELGCVD